MTKQTLILAGSALLILGLLIGCGSGSSGIAGGSFEGLPTAAMPSTIGAIGGIISDANSLPVNGATVTLYANGLPVTSTTTGTDGSYFISVSPGIYELRVTKTGYLSTSQSVSIEAARVTTNSIPLTSTTGTISLGKIRGLITDQTDQAKSGALVRLISTTAGGSSAEFTTGTDGAYSLSLPAGNYTMTVTKAGYATDQRAVTIAANVEQILDIKLGAKVTMTGSVKLNTTQENLPNINVDVTKNKVFLSSTVTTVNGQFILEDLGPGMYELCAGRVGANETAKYEPATYVVQILSSGTVSPSSPVLYLSAKIPVVGGSQPYHEVASGTIFDAYTGAPLEYVTCTLKGVGSVLTDLKGQFSFTNLLPGNYEMTFSKLGWSSQTVTFSIVATTTVGAPLANDTTMNPATFSYSLLQSSQTNLGAISGRFIDETTLMGVSNLAVRLYVYRLVAKKIRVMTAPETTSASATYETQEVSKWELDGYNNPQPVLSTLTGRDSSGNEISSGTFRLEHLQPTTSTTKYLVFIGTTSNAIISTIAVQDAADTNVPPATWYQENLASAQRKHSWALVDVTANTTTFLQNFNLPNY